MSASRPNESAWNTYMSASRPNESAWNMVQRYGLYWESPNKEKKKTMRFLSLNR